MAYDNNSRLNMQEKKRKTNLILNSSIAVVLGLIVIVGSIIFLNDENSASNEENDQTIAEQHLASDESENETESSDEKSNENNNSNDNDNSLTASEKEENEEDAEAAEEEEKEKEEKEIEKKEKEKKEKEKKEEQKRKEKEEKKSEDSLVTEASDDPEVQEESVNEAWKPIGTSQTGEHTSSYDEGSVDWNEKVKAISYATGISPDNMTIWFIGNHEGSPHKSVGTVSSGDDPDTKYRVYLEWVDKKGWKPTSMQKLAPGVER